MNFLRIIFAWGGRIDRTTYLALMGLMSILGFVYWPLAGQVAAASPFLGSVVTLISWPVFGWSGLVINVKRLRDMGRSPLLAILPMGPILLAAFLVIPTVIGAAAAKDAGAIISALVSGGLILGVAALVNFGMSLWMCFAGGDPNAPGEKLSLFPRDGGGDGRRGADAPAFDADAMLAAALARREAEMGGQSAQAAAPMHARLAGLPQRAATPTIGPGGGAAFGRRN